MISASDISATAEKIKGVVHRTPILTSSFFDRLTGAQLFFKCENFQKTGSFKARGASNSVMSLDSAKAARGVATHSSGNHGQALAWAAAQAGIKAYIVMPDNAPSVKVAAVKEYGAEVIFCEPTLEARESVLSEVLQSKGASFIPPYNYENTIRGQSTAALEILDELSGLDYLLCPVGGGGLLSGSALSAHYHSPLTNVIGCEPEEADDAYRSFHSGKLEKANKPTTIADGLRTSLGDITFSYITEYVSDILLCSEEEIISAQRALWERMKIVVEPSAAVPLACLLKNTGRFQGKKVALILSGGNVDLSRLPFTD